MRERIKAYTISVRQAIILLSNGVLRMRIVTRQCRLHSRDITISTCTSCTNTNSLFCLQDVFMLSPDSQITQRLFL